MSSLSDIIGSIVFIFSLCLILHAMLSCKDIREFIVLFAIAYIILAILDLKREMRNLSNVKGSWRK